MYQNSIIRISAAMAGILLMAGCTVRLDPAPKEVSIDFSAGSVLLRDDAEFKSGTPRTGDSFVTNDQIAVYGWHNGGSQFMSFGSTDPVELGSNGSWTYSPIEFWLWQGSTDYYDFMALYPNDCGQTVTYNPLKATLTYDPTSSQYDLMTASYRRSATDDQPCGAVPLSFSHRLSAVRVVVSNPAGAQEFQLESCKFRYLIVSAKANVTYKNNVFSFAWSDYARSGSELLGSDPAYDLAANSSIALDYDLMIPQALDPLGYVPSIVLTYKLKTGDSTYGESITSVISLKDILKEDKVTPIDEWEAGTIYTYNIVIRIGGGVSVNVVTTPWDVVEAETPGIMI